MFPSVRAQVEATIVRHVGDAVLKSVVQSPNVVQRANLLLLIKALFAATVAPSYTMCIWPWRLPAQYDGQDLTTRAFSVTYITGGVNAYWEAQSTAMGNVDDARARRYATPWSILQSTWRQSIGAILTSLSGVDSPDVITASDMGVSYIGTPWAQPAITGGTVSIGTGGIGGASYLHTFAAFDGVTGGGASGYAGPPADGNAFVRILDGVDAGLYRIRFIDTTNSRMYLSNLDGTHFVATGGLQSAIRAVVYYRTAAYFNPGVGVIASSQGTVAFDGAFDPGITRASYIFRLHYEKTGSPNPSGGAHLKGSYWFSVRPWIFGHGIDATTYPSQGDVATIGSSAFLLYKPNLFPSGSAGIVGGSPGVALDVTNQRLWFALDDGTNSSVSWWLYKSPECGHEVATNNGTPNSPITGFTMTGARARALEMGSDGTVYVALGGGANAGVVKVTTGLAATQWLSSSAGLGAAVNGLKVDTTRARSTAAGTVSTGLASAGAANRILVTGGAFTQADVGRAITLSGGTADNGTYKISAYVDATHVDVTTLAGAGVTFTGTTNSGAMRIGDRIYLFWNDATSNGGSGAGFISLRYMESEAFGTILTTGDLAVTASTGRTLYDGHATAKGAKPAIAIDPATGNLYWSSTDTAARLNRFDVTSRTVSQKTAASFTEPADGSALTEPTLISGIGVNPHAAFREVWLGTDQGLIRFSPDHADLSTLTTGAYAAVLPTNQYRRYYGSGVATAYTQPANFTRPSGETINSTSHAFCDIFFGPDGKAYASLTAVAAAEAVRYLREQDLFVCADTPVNRASNGVPNSAQSGYLITSNGEVVRVMGHASLYPIVTLSSSLVDYQWTGAAWTAKEAVRGVIPDATSQPGCTTRDLHTTSEPLLYGVRVAFATGAGGDATQFIGRMSQKQAAQADGAWNAGTVGNWGGSNFTAADVGRILRVESGTQQGIYLVTGYVGANTLTVQTLARAAYNATGEAGPLTYTLWDLGATTAGAEVCTVLASHGIGADNTQDVTNISAEMFFMRTALSDGVEAIKTALGPIPPAGSAAVLAYLDSYPAAAGNVSPGIPSGLALSAAAVTPPEPLLDYAAGRYGHDNTAGRLNLGLPGPIGGVDVQSILSGYAVTVDLGTEVEVGAIIVRTRNGTADPPVALHTDTQGTAGTLANLHKASTTAPVASATVTHRRGTLTGASGLGLPRAAPPTATLTAGDFLGTASVTYNDGTTTQGGNTFGSALGRFTSREGAVLRVVSGGDVGYYRITAVSPDGATATVRNLAQTAKAWGATAAGLDFTIYADAAREDDILLSGTFKTTIEMLTSPTTARVRTYNAAALTNAAWEVLTPTWTLVKRLAAHVMAQPPDVANNRTYAATDGRDLDAGSGDDGTVKHVFDLTDLTTAQRTGRWWKFTSTGRFVTAATTTNWLSGVEFYDTTGKRLLAGKDGQVDTVESEPNFFATHVTRLDWIQALYAASAAVPGVNALATIGGAKGDTITLAGGAAFRGLQIGPTGSTLTVDASGYVNLGGADRPFTAADVGRILWIQAGPNQGYYRIVTVASGTQVTSVLRPSGTAVTLAVDATPRAWSLHEGILAGTLTYDYLYLAGYGEFTVKSVSDDLLTVTINETTYVAAAGVAWEIRRRAIPYGFGAAAGVDATKVARLLYSSSEQPRQSGDVMQDHRGGLGFHATDVGTPIQRADGVVAGGSGAFTGTAFTKDDVGRLLTITTGANKGPYRISAFTSAVAVTLANARTGAAVTLAADAGPVTYKVTGERRFRASRYATVLRQ